jgi:hypothetical protein
MTSFDGLNGDIFDLRAPSGVSALITSANSAGVLLSTT